MIYTSTTHEAKDTWQLGYQLGSRCRGGETFELVSDLGGGKTIIAQGLAAGLGYPGEVTSPTFVVSRDYQISVDRSFHHFDLYRIAGADIVAAELGEFIADPQAVVAVEWANNIPGVLPKDRITIDITSTGESEREIQITTADQYDYLLKGLGA